MNLGEITQQPAEVLDYDIPYVFEDFPDQLERVVSVVVTPTPELTALVTLASVDRAKLWLSFTPAPGVTGGWYKVEFTLATVGGRTFQDEFDVFIEDV